MDKEINTQETAQFVIDTESSSTEHFTIRSDKAAEILGVNRTRLSQLTSKGLFPYERRKVDSRSRLFYRLNDLLNYQRKSSFGNLQTKAPSFIPETKALIPFVSSDASKLSVAPQMQVTSISNQAQQRPKDTIRAKRILKSALDVKTVQQEKYQIEHLIQKVSQLEKHLELLSHLLENTQGMVKKQTLISRVKKSSFQRPRVKRFFKRIKR